MLLQDFTINGQAVDHIEGVDEDNALESFRDILLYVYGERRCPGDASYRTCCPLALWSAVDCTVKLSGRSSTIATYSFVSRKVLHIGVYLE